MYLKNISRGRVSEYVENYSGAVYVPVDQELDHNPMWKDHKSDCAFPSATQNEISKEDADKLGIKDNKNFKLDQWKNIVR